MDNPTQDSPPSIRQEILTSYQNFSPKQRKIADYILANEEKVAFASAQEIGEAVGSSAATVVRFARALNLDGYTDLQDRIRANFPQFRTAMQTMTDRLKNGGVMQRIVNSVLEINAQNIQDIQKLIDTALLDRVAHDLMSSSRIYIFANGLTAGTALIAAYSWQMLGYHARAIINGGVAQELEFLQINDQDCVVLISIYRYLRSTIEAARSAREKNAKIIAITDSPVSPIASLSNEVLVSSTNRAAHNYSLTGIITIIDLISAHMIANDPNKTMEALNQFNEIYKKYGGLGYV